MGAGIEYGIGFWRMVFLYVLSGLGGITLSMCCRPEAHGVGASTAVFGLVGFFVAYLFTNWWYMGRERPGQRIYLLIFTLALVLLNLNIGPGSDSHIDNFGHLGGFITGILIGLSLTENYDDNARDAGRTPDRFTEREYKEKSTCCKSCCCNWCGRIFLIIWFTCLFYYFYFIMDINFEDPPDDDS